MQHVARVRHRQLILVFWAVDVRLIEVCDGSCCTFFAVPYASEVAYTVEVKRDT